MSDPNFRFLDDDSLQFLESDNRIRMAYVDMLALFHDLLVQYAKVPERPRFKSEECLRRLENLVHAFPSESQAGVASRENVAAAETLHSKLTASAGKERVALIDEAESFLRAVFQEYNTIRVLRSRDGLMVER